MDPLTPEFWIGIGIAALCGGIIGLERQAREKPFGIRTSVLICLGTYVFIRLGASFSEGADPTRVLGQVVTGIGFLGAGVMLTREGHVRGVTSAATIWVLAAIGCVVGLRYHLGAVALAAIAVLILWGVEWVEGLLRRDRERRANADED